MLGLYRLWRREKGEAFAGKWRGLGGTVENLDCRVSLFYRRSAPMRGLWILLIVSIIVSGVAAQPNAEEKPRFGIAPNTDLYPQTTPKAALESAIKLLENKRYDYFVAQILDPGVLEAKIRDRAERLEAVVERDLLRKRDEQKASPDSIPALEKLSIEPKEFAAAIAAEAQARSFKFVVKDLQAQLDEYPENLKLFRKFLAEGQLAETGTTASYAHKDIPGKTLYLKNNGKRWFLEDKQVDEPKATSDK